MLERVVHRRWYKTYDAGVHVLLILSFLLAPTAHAAGNDVLFYTGNSGFEYSEFFPPELLEEVVEEECGGFVDTDEWPATLDAYRMIVLVHPSDPWTPTQISQLTSFLAEDGVVVAVGDSREYDRGHIAPMNGLFESLGIDSRLQSASIDPGCFGNRALPVGDHPLTQNIGDAGIQYGWSSDITVAPGATQLLVGVSGQTLAAVEGQVVIISDNNVFLDDCNLDPVNRPLYANLYHYGASDTSCDMDEDGVIADHCAGDDCNDCDTAAGRPQSWFPDRDDDGFGDSTSPVEACEAPSLSTLDNSDCDDSNPLSYPGADEQCDGVDNDCDGATPSNEQDSDEDGFRVCDDDCDDTSSATRPGAPELCDGIDNDCDTVIPSIESDSDEDGFRVCDDDCDDSVADIFPGAQIECIGVDYNCDGSITDDERDTDEDAVCDPDDLCPGEDDSLDADEDGIPDACDDCMGADATGDQDQDGFCDDRDCDDTNPLSYPGADEQCDGLDNDCDDVIPADESDDDDDGFRVCEQDCDDTSADVYPQAAVICLGVDVDCDGTITPEEMDTDNDGVCDPDDICGAGDDTTDTDQDTVPDACDLCDGDDATGDADSDGFCTDLDCDDTNDTVYPSAPELCDGLDNACTGALPTEDADMDNDGYTICDGDCDDADAAVAPDQVEVCSDGLDNDCTDGDQPCPDPIDDSDGCGCQTSSNTPLMALPLLVGLIGLRRRRTSLRTP